MVTIASSSGSRESRAEAEVDDTGSAAKRRVDALRRRPTPRCPARWGSRPRSAARPGGRRRRSPGRSAERRSWTRPPSRDPRSARRPTGRSARSSTAGPRTPDGSGRRPCRRRSRASRARGAPPFPRRSERSTTGSGTSGSPAVEVRGGRDEAVRLDEIRERGHAQRRSARQAPDREAARDADATGATELGRCSRVMGEHQRVRVGEQLLTLGRGERRGRGGARPHERSR